MPVIMAFYDPCSVCHTKCHALIFVCHGSPIDHRHNIPHLLLPNINASLSILINEHVQITLQGRFIHLARS